MLESLFEFLGSIAVKLFSKLPVSSFAYSDYVIKLDDILGNLNYFIPIHDFNNIFKPWLMVMFASIAIFMLIKFISGIRG